MGYLPSSRPRKKDYYQKRGLMAVKGKNERERLTTGVLESGSLLGDRGIQAHRTLLVTEEDIFRGTLQGQTIGFTYQLLTLFGRGPLPVLCSCSIERRMVVQG